MRRAVLCILEATLSESLGRVCGSGTMFRENYFTTRFCGLKNVMPARVPHMFCWVSGSIVSEQATCCAGKFQKSLGRTSITEVRSKSFSLFPASSASILLSSYLVLCIQSKNSRVYSPFTSRQEQHNIRKFSCAWIDIQPETLYSPRLCFGKE